MTVEDIQALFTTPDGYRFARWGRAVVPVVFGVDDATLDVIRAAIRAATALAGVEMGAADAELGANFMLFFFRDWDELAEVPDLGEMIPDLPALLARLKAADAQTYRTFRFDRAGAIKACFSFVRMGGPLADLPADALATGEAVSALLTWAQTPPLARASDGTIGPRPEIASL
ncbi:MAG TPA: hypothetical protein ENK83_02230, partial [Aliiroseovarius sp.]|nr:hypothetical protein [Aliiroseovarius sp.]